MPQSNPPCILLYEDEPDAAGPLKDFLELKGFEAIWAQDGDEFRRALAGCADRLSLAILDVMAPGLDGYEALGELRARPETAAVPVIFLTAKDADEDEIKGLALGADDYLRKPASLGLILAHVEARLRRAEQSEAEIYRAGPVALDAERRAALIDGNPERLTNVEYALLHLFMRQPRKVFNRQELIDRIHTEDNKAVYDRTVDAHIKNLRSKLGPHAALVKTWRGLGYGLNPEYLDE